MKAENNKKLKEKKNWILLLLKKLAKILFNRIFYVAVAMLVQLGWIFLMVLRLAAFSRYVDIVIKLVGVVLVLWILNKEINPSYKLAWTMLILILPILGVVLYFVFGRSRIATIMQQHFEQRIEESREYLRDRPETRQKLEEHGISCAGKTARQMTPLDYERYDHLIVMDHSNLQDALRIAGEDPQHKISMLMDATARPRDVADPWFTGDFESTWQDVLEGCTALLEKLRP